MPLETLPDQTDAAGSLILAAAEKEICAFLRAVTHIFGLQAAGRAADLWIAAFEELDAEKIAAPMDFSRITIQAAARLAADATREEFLVRAFIRTE